MSDARSLTTGRSLDGRRFEIAVRRLADSLNHGVDPSPWVGPGIEYAQSRPFVDGDDVRAIDWRLTARTRRWYVKEYETARRLPVVVVVDTSASMHVASVRPSKAEVALHLAGGLALAGLARSSPVALVDAGAAAAALPPTGERGQVLLWLHRLRRAAPGPTRLGEALDRLGRLLPSRGVVLVLSDLHDPVGVAVLRRLALEHDCAVIQPIDPAEHGRFAAGFIDAAEAESARRRPGHGGTAWCDPLATGRQLAAAGVDHLALPTDRPLVARVRRFLRERDRRRSEAPAPTAAQP